MRIIANTQANKNQGAQLAGGGAQSSQNRHYWKELSNRHCFIYKEMGHYASFHDQRMPPPVVAHAGPVYASGALPANIVSVLEDYCCPEMEDNTISAGNS